MKNGRNEICITKTAATLGRLLGLADRGRMDAPIEAVLAQADAAFGDEGCDRIFMYNPDAIAMWIYEKYRGYFARLEERAALRLPMLSVFPPVTPVCFASMYSGLMPEAHGIIKYEKPVLSVETVFDALVRGGKRPAIVSTEGDSISRIFLERKIDYYIYPDKEQCNRKALELIGEDQHDLIVLYNGDYDYYMHRFTPEGKRSLRALKENIATYNTVFDEVKRCWKKHNSIVAFSPDHGCHRSHLILGNHGKDAPCDMNIMHFYGFVGREGGRSN